MRRFEEFGAVIRVNQLRSGQWESSVDGIRVCLTDRERTAQAVARARARHEEERRDAKAA